MSERILITGGAGFIGSHLARQLLRDGHEVRALDRLDPQVHPERERPSYLEDEVELIKGDVRDPAAVEEALQGIDAVVHLAARVGVGQSMYEIADYCSVNTVGTGVLLEAMLEREVRRLVVASSMSIYGEGLYRARDGSTVAGSERPLEQLRAADWEVRDASGDVLVPVGTPESKAPSLASIYALSKFDQ
jgi:dTDP-L-rhamnose 4-epimerase